MTMHSPFLPWQGYQTGRNKPENVGYTPWSSGTISGLTNHFKSSPLVFVVGPPYPIGGVDPIFLKKCEMFNRDDNALFWSVICFHMKTIPTSKRLARSLTYWRRPRFSDTRFFTPHWLQNIGTGRVSCSRYCFCCCILFFVFLSGTRCLGLSLKILVFFWGHGC